MKAWKETLAVGVCYVIITVLAAVTLTACIILRPIGFFLERQKKREGIRLVKDVLVNIKAEGLGSPRLHK